MRTSCAFLSAIIYLLTFPGPKANGQDDRSWVEVPVIVNICSVKTANGEQLILDPELAKAAVEEASKILKQARIKLKVVKVNRGDQDPVANAGDANRDGKFTTAELEDAGAAANDELIGTFKDAAGDPTHQGTKVWFCVVPDASSPANLGHSEHNEPRVFVRWVPTKPAEGQPKPEVATGTVIAHELCHAWSLGAQHTVGPNETADEHGHTDKDTRPTNVMSPVDVPGTNTELTDEQETEIRWGAIGVGVEHESEDQSSFPQKTEQQKGGQTDPPDDTTGEPGKDLSNAFMWSWSSDTWVWFQLFFSTWFGDDVVMDLLLRWYFDADGNVGTGITIGEFAGIDREVEVHLIGNGFSPPFAEARLINYTMGGLAFPLAPPVFEIEELFFDDFPVSRTLPGDHRLSMQVDKALLDFTADTVPTHVVLEDMLFGVVDTLSFNYGQRTWERTPEVSADAIAAGLGQPVNFMGVGFAPNAVAAAYLDESPIASGLAVQPDGTVSGSFDLCSLPETGDYFFLTVVDDAARFDFTALRVDWPDEGFDEYVTGSEMHGQGGWKGWDNDPAFSAPVTRVQSRSPAQAVEIFGTADLVHEYCTDGGSVWSVSAWQYIPGDFSSNTSGQFAGSFFVLLNTYTDGGPHDADRFSAQLQFDSNDGMLKVYHGNGLNTVNVPLQDDRWVKIQAIVDEATDWTQIYYDDELVTEYPWTGGVLGGGAGALDVGAVDLVGNGTSPLYYDDIRLDRGCGDSYTDDRDADGADTATELRSGTNSCDPDTDGDGLLDGFEIEHSACVDPLFDDGVGDPDLDLLDNVAERAAGSDPCVGDTDDDGLLDGADNCPRDSNAGQEDGDGDGVGDACDACPGFDDAIDSDGDGLPDACDLCAGGASSGDADGDGNLGLGDFTAMSVCLLGPAGGLGDGCECFDFDGDRDGDLADFAVFQSTFAGE